jgi:hypothetical protein
LAGKPSLAKSDFVCFDPTADIVCDQVRIADAVADGDVLIATP